MLELIDTAQISALALLAVNKIPPSSATRLVNVST
jgi:hypothetical protein